MATRQNQKDTRNIILTIVGVTALLLVAIMFFHDNIQPRNLIKSLAQYSNADHGDTIEEFALQTRDEEYEFVAVFDAEGKKLVECTLNNSSMSALPLEVDQCLSAYHRQDLITAHNHPGEDHTFSDADMLITHKGRPYAMQLVFGHDHAYILQPGDHGWPTYKESWKYLDDVYVRFISGDSDVAKQITTDATGAPLYTTEDFARCYAENFGLRYSVTDLDNFKLTDWVP